MNAQTNTEPLQRYHLASCAKYESLRGIYPNDHRLTGKDCSCGLEALIEQKQIEARIAGEKAGRSDELVRLVEWGKTIDKQWNKHFEERLSALKKEAIHE